MKIDSALISGSYTPVATGEKETMETDAFKTALEKAAEDKDLTRLKEASQEFEAYFVNSIFKEMRKTIQDGGLVEKSEATTTFEEMLDEEMSKTISKKGGIGLSDMIYNNMLRVYGGTAAPEVDKDVSSDTDADVVPETEPISTGVDIKG